MKSKLGRKGENEMAVRLNQQNFIEERKLREQKRKEIAEVMEAFKMGPNLALQEEYVRLMKVKIASLQKVLEPTTRDGENAILAAGAMSGGNVPPSCVRTKSVAQLYKEQGRKYKKEARERRFAKVKRFLMGVNPTKKINP